MPPPADPLPDLPPDPAPRRLLPWAVLAVGLALTAALGFALVKGAAMERRALLERHTEAFSQALAGRVQSYIDTLPGLRVFWLLDQSPNDAELQRYVEAISLQRRFPGLAVTFVAEYLRPADRDAFVARVRGDRSLRPAGHPDFDIRPPGERAEYMVLRHLYPEDRPGFGYDLYDPTQNYRPAVEAAVTSGGYVATAPLLLARDRLKPLQPELTSVVVRAAVYRGGRTPATAAERRRDAQGVVGIAFRTSELVQALLPPELLQLATLRIVDPRAALEGGNALVFDSAWLADAAAPARAPVAAPEGPSTLSAVVGVGDRGWEIAVHERAPATVAGLAGVSWLMLALGAALSASLAVMTRTLVQGRAVAEARVRTATAALRAEKDHLADSERRYRMLFESSLDAVLRTRPDGTVLAANPAACALFGMSEERVRAAGRNGLIDPDDPRVTRLIEQRLRSGRASGQCRLRRADGSVFEAEVSASAYVDMDGEDATSLILRDVTERHRLAERQARLAAILDTTPDFVGSADLEGRAFYINRAGRAMLGRTADDDLADLRIADCHPPWAARHVLEEGVPAALRHGVWSGESALLGADGGEIPVSQVILCHRDLAGRPTHLSTIARDLSESRRAQAEREALEQRLRQAQKMESIGTLAGGVAHDFNNVLAAILGNVAIARDDLGAAHPSQPQLALIQQAAARARSLVQQILTFSRRTPQERRVQPLRPLVEEALALLRATLPSTAVLEATLADAPLPVLADAAQVQQVLLNLCTNAWQALPGQQGTIRVELAAVAFDLIDPAPGGLPPGRYARLCVSDDGCGMDAATRERIFEPFFTTKPIGQGTGLGLSVVHGIVASSGGSIAVESSPGAGTRFEILLPLARPGAAAAAPADDGTPAAPAGRGEELLYVDDDEVVALTVQALLTRAGYRVTLLPEGAAAVAAVEREPARWAAVITDYNMPGLSGLAVAEALRERAPRLPVLMTSGYVTEELQERARAAGVRAVLLKEYTLERLGGLLQQVLTAGG